MPSFVARNFDSKVEDVRDKYDQIVDKETVSSLITKAKEVRVNSHSPYSNFKVGAAVLGANGRIFVGANVENASYGLTICAERSALVSAISQGQNSFRAIAIASSSEQDEYCPPCGACRQFMMEFGEYPIILTKNTSEEIMVTSTTELLPGNFSNENMAKKV